VNPLSFLINLRQKIKALFANTNKSRMQSSDQEMAQKTLTMLALTQEEELTCDEVFALIDQFTEMAIRGEDVAGLMPLVKQHLDLCGDCREEYEVLQGILTNTG
jgi:hypothetical protein